MKKFFLVLISFFLVACLSNTKAQSKTYTIYIDPGHGGADGGAYINNVKEADINLAVSIALYERLSLVGFKVYLTRDGDYDLAPEGSQNRKRDDIHKRVDLINKSDCDIYISIHTNAIHSSVWRGSQVFYKENETNAKFGKIMQDNLIDILKNTDRSAKSISDKYLIDNVSKKGLLVELGFISNPEEAKLLSTLEYQSLIAYAIFVGILDYLNLDL